MRSLVIFNDGAGSAVSKESLQELLQQQNYDVVWLPSKSIGELPEQLEGIDIVVAAGGDGTVTKAALQLGSDDPPIGILPLGTANNIANTLGISGTLSEIAASWATTAPTPLDVWQAKGPWGKRRFIEGCGLGALTQMAHQMDTQEITGHSTEHEIAIARAALLKIFTHAKPVEAAITLDEDTIEGEFLMLEMLNFGLVGPRLPLAWSADPFDGDLDVGYALQDDYNALCRWLSAGAEPLSESPITVRRAHKIHIRWRDSRFRIGDKYWPSLKQDEPSGKFEVVIRLIKHKPNILRPRPPEEE